MLAPVPAVVVPRVGPVVDAVGSTDPGDDGLIVVVVDRQVAAIGEPRIRQGFDNVARVQVEEVRAIAGPSRVEPTLDDAAAHTVEPSGYFPK